MEALASQFALQFSKSVPLFVLMALGYGLSRWGGFPKAASAALSRFALYVALSSMLFRLMSRIFSSGITADLRLLVAFFGACGLVFLAGRLFVTRCLRLAPVDGVVFATGGVFSNNGMLGLPLALAMLGEPAMPSVAAVLSVNAMILWTLASVAVELARGGSLEPRQLLAAAKNVFSNPLIIAIFSGVCWGLTGLGLPAVVDEPLRLLGDSATPLCLVVVGMGLAEFGVRFDASGLALSATKLLAMPASVFALASLLGLGRTETVAVTFLGGLPMAVNVYLMARHYGACERIVSNAMVATTVASAFTVPLIVTLLNFHYGP